MVLAISESMGVNLSKQWEAVKDSETWCAAVHGVAQSWTWLSEQQQCLKLRIAFDILDFGYGNQKQISP